MVVRFVLVARPGRAGLVGNPPAGALEPIEQRRRVPREPVEVVDDDRACARGPEGGVQPCQTLPPTPADAVIDEDVGQAPALTLAIGRDPLALILQRHGTLPRLLRTADVTDSGYGVSFP